jgi:hypothetical protein
MLAAMGRALTAKATLVGSSGAAGAHRAVVDIRPRETGGALAFDWARVSLLRRRPGHRHCSNDCACNAANHVDENHHHCAPPASAVRSAPQCPQLVGGVLRETNPCSSVA